MGLFDDLLGGSKPTQTQTPTPTTPVAQPTSPVVVDNTKNVGASSASGIDMPAVDPMLVMNEQTTSTPPSLDDILNISAGNVTTNMPSYTAQKAALSESPAIITDSTPSTPTISVSTTDNKGANPVIITETENISYDANTPPVTTANVSAGPNVPVVAPVESELVGNNSTLASESNLPSGNSKESPTTSIPNDWLFAGMIGAEEEKISETPTDISPTTTSDISKNEDSLFGAISEEKPLENENSNSQTLDSTIDFIAASLVQLEAMEATIRNKQEKFLEEAKSYEMKKNEFAELEKKAIENSHSMDNEKKRIENLKAYFKKQQAGADMNDSVNTALAGASVKNAVDMTMEKKPTTRKKAPEKHAA